VGGNRSPVLLGKNPKKLVILFMTEARSPSRAQWAAPSATNVAFCLPIARAKGGLWHYFLCKIGSLYSIFPVSKMHTMKKFALLLYLALLPLLVVVGQKKVQTRYGSINESDSLATPVKEEYFVINNGGKEVIEGDYKRFFRSGKVKVTGKFVGGNMTGAFKQFYENGAQESITSFVGGRKQGQQVEYYENGRIKIEYAYVDDRREGEVRAFDLQGQAIQKGMYRNNFLQDTFYTYFPDQKLKSKAVFRNDSLNGIMSEYYTSGVLKNTTRYVDHVQHGQALAYYDNGVAESQIYYRNGVMSPDTIRTWYRNGQLQTEILKDNNRYNVFTKYASNGNKTMEGSILMRERTGFLSRPNMGAEAVLGAVLDGKVRGYYDSGKTWYELNYAKGKKNGTNTYYHENGNTKEVIVYRDQERELKSKLYYENGKPELEKELKNGNPVGEWSYYHPNGQLKRKEQYVMGKVNGPRSSWHANGKLAAEELFSNGNLAGNQKYFYENGNPKEEFSYKMGKINGLVKYYHENGKLASGGAQLNDRKTGTWVYYDAQSKLLRTEKWRKGELVSTVEADKK